MIPPRKIRLAFLSLLLFVSCSQKNASLTSSTSFLTLAVNGKARTITLSNPSRVRTAREVSYSVSPALPEGTTISPEKCGDIAKGGTCTLTITPGANASATAGDTEAVPVTLTLDGTNTDPVEVTLNILTLGSVYQAGYVFAIDDTTADSQSIGGKVVALAAQTGAGGIIWSSNGNSALVADATLDHIAGISDNSLPPGQACDGKANGFCNTLLLAEYYVAVNTAYYAAGLCRQYRGGDYSDWYLPAICEMGYDGDTFGADCGTRASPSVANIQSNLVDNGNIGGLAGVHWSSTQSSGDPNAAWYHFFDAGTNQRATAKFIELGVRCARNIAL